jgi:hypothetical protein
MDDQSAAPAAPPSLGAQSPPERARAQRMVARSPPMAREAGLSPPVQRATVSLSSPPTLTLAVLPLSPWRPAVAAWPEPDGRQ